MLMLNWPWISVVKPGRSRSKNGVASLAYDPGIHLSSEDGLPGQARQ
jgi:hypothetical protein